MASLVLYLSFAAVMLRYLLEPARIHHMQYASSYSVSFIYCTHFLFYSMLKLRLICIFSSKQLFDVICSTRLSASSTLEMSMIALPFIFCFVILEKLHRDPVHLLHVITCCADDMYFNCPAKNTTLFPWSQIISCLIKFIQNNFIIYVQNMYYLCTK